MRKLHLFHGVDKRMNYKIYATDEGIDLLRFMSAVLKVHTASPAM